MLVAAVSGGQLYTSGDSGTTWVARENNPVSYTHLRAHETVLDLVCRLLLEKKKQNLQRTLLCI